MRINLYKTICILAVGLCINSQVDAQTLTKYAKQKQQEIIERQHIEKQKYEEACQKGTLEAFREYAKAYPKGKYIDDINNRIKDFTLWSKASSDNTIASYTLYLQKSIFQSFKSQAKNEIKKLESIEEWKRVKTSNNRSDIEHFISSFPLSPCIADARKRIHELNAVNLYNSGNLRGALNEFNEAGGRLSIQFSNQSLYDNCKEYYEFSLLSSNSKEEELESFLTDYPNSQYTDDISNMLALVKAKGFSIYSSEYSLKSAISLAKDETTRSLVRHYYDVKMREYAQYKKEQRRAKRYRDGGIVNFGIEILDIGINPKSYDDYDADLDYVMYCNVGIGIKLGNYKSPIQFELGAKPGLNSYTVWYDIDDETKTYFHLPLYARLKIGITGGNYNKWYIDGIGYYNVIKNSFLESDYSWSIGVGISWRHWDWRTLYYKQDINPINTYSDFIFIGSSLSYYF